MATRQSGEEKGKIKQKQNPELFMIWLWFLLSKDFFGQLPTDHFQRS